jgi:arylsulfatase A-like enzyme
MAPGPALALAFLGLCPAQGGLGGGGSRARSTGDEGSVLVVLADDLGVEALPMYGLDPLLPPGLTPNLDALAAQGLRFENAWGAPKCSPARAALLTGRAAFRTGIGNVIESGGFSLPEEELTLPEMMAELAPFPYATGFFGKWHLERPRSGEPCAPSARHGFQHFEGTLLYVPTTAEYCAWNERVCSGATGLVQPVLEYMPARVFDGAARWIASRRGPWLCVVAPQLPYDQLHNPPRELQSVRGGPECAECAPGTRACFDAAIQALDTKLGDLLASLGPDWPERITVFFTADNGTPNSVGRYWPAGHGKTTFYEGGVRVPFVVAGRAVAPGRRGKAATALVSLADVYRTVARLAGVERLPKGLAQDSFDLSPLLGYPRRPTGRSHLWTEKFARNQAAPPYLDHRVAIRDRRFKLMYDWSDRRALHLYDLEADPRELVDLLEPAPPQPGTEAGDALAALTELVFAELGP